MPIAIAETARTWHAVLRCRCGRGGCPACLRRNVDGAIPRLQDLVPPLTHREVRLVSDGPFTVSAWDPGSISWRPDLNQHPSQHTP